jgi:hypothetical protein
MRRGTFGPRVGFFASYNMMFFEENLNQRKKFCCKMELELLKMRKMQQNKMGIN